ncbi:hypothetical protein ACWEVM_12285 [Streptomyces bauhiniae]|uniref:hypothetical protein n=1 Tax=Streptomyces bauhiniae TaxID=2340725 RepID=UPI00369EA583
MTLRSGALMLVPGLGSLIAAALHPGTGDTGMTLHPRALILVPALFVLVAVAWHPGTGAARETLRSRASRSWYRRWPAW